MAELAPCTNESIIPRAACRNVMCERGVSKRIPALLALLMIAVQVIRAQTTAWPHSFPCRVNNGKSPHVLFLTLGSVSTPVAQGMYDPLGDLVTLNSGTVYRHYFRDVLGIPNYKPIDKSSFPLPPTGWTSWTAYRYSMNEDTIRKVADFLDTTLRPFGLKYLEIDDGWEVPWNIWKPNLSVFPNRMDSIARYIKGRNMIPGIWLIPQSVCDTEDIIAYDAFLRRSDGSTIVSRIGRALVDPEAPQGAQYLRRLVDTLKGWGYGYLKTDYQPTVGHFYDSLAYLSWKPGLQGVELYRKTMEILRNAAGPSTFIAACYESSGAEEGLGTGAPISAADYFSSLRFRFDVSVSPWYYQQLFNGLMDNLALHNIAAYMDPDAFSVCDTVDRNFAILWASTVAMAGMPTFCFDRPSELPEDRLEILRRVLPAVDVRPMDLFLTRSNPKQIWDLKVSDSRRTYDIVGIMRNPDYASPTVTIDWNEMGWGVNDEFYVYDFWNKKYLGSWRNSLSLHVDPVSCRILSFVRVDSTPVLLSTNRHITQGWLEIDSLVYDPNTETIRGVSEVVGRDTYELRFAVPMRKQVFMQPALVLATGASVLGVTQEGPLVAVRLLSEKSKAVSWSVAFKDDLSSVQQEAATPSEIRIDGVFPNPTARAVGGNATVRVACSGTLPITITVRDLVGRVIQTPFRGFLTSGFHDIALELGLFPVGACFVEVTNGQSHAVCPIVGAP
jgi:hypothetical protein